MTNHNHNHPEHDLSADITLLANLSRQWDKAVEANAWTTARDLRKEANTVSKRHGGIDAPAALLEAWRGNDQPVWAGNKSYEERKKFKANDPKGFSHYAQDPFRKGRFASTDNIGPVMSLIGEWKPKTREAWEQKFINYHALQGRPNIIEETARALYNRGDVKGLTKQQAWDVAATVIIDQTYDGYITEIKFAEFTGSHLEAQGFRLEAGRGTDDIHRGADFLYYKEGSTNREGIQVKPQSYTTTHKNGDKYATHRHNMAKFTRFQETYGGSVSIAYAAGEWWANLHYFRDGFDYESLYTLENLPARWASLYE